MHNKLMVMDNALAIVGGRNMSNPYFEVDPRANFRDLDIAAAGPVVRDLSRVFDRFWNGDWSVPIAALVDRPYGEADYRAHVQRAREEIAKGGYPHPLDEDVAALKSELSSIVRSFVWAPAHAVYDDPASMSDQSGRVMYTLLYQRFDRLQTELLIESAYFIPLDRGVAKLKELVDRGVRVRVLTNSLASNDVLAAFAGYSKRREAMVRNGVELYELRPEPGPVRKRLFGGSSRAGLHTKAIVFDRKDVFIGSFNLDARSSAINTEAGLYVESPALAAQVIEFMNEGVDPDVSFRLELDKEGKLDWVAEDEGTPLRYDKDPMTTFLQRFAAGLDPPVTGRYSALAASVEQDARMRVQHRAAQSAVCRSLARPSVETRTPRGRARLQQTDPRSPQLWRVRCRYPAGRSALTPGLVESPDLEPSRRRSTNDLVLDRHRLEPCLASRSIPRNRLSSCFHESEIRDRVVWAIVPVEDDLLDLHVSTLDADPHLLDVLRPPTA